MEKDKDSAEYFMTEMTQKEFTERTGHIEPKACKFNLVNVSNCVYKPENYPGPIAIDAKVSKEMDEYHKNAKIQINVDGKTYMRDVNDSGEKD